MTMVLEPNTKVLCPKCHGNGVNRLPHGITVCPRCLGHCEIYREYLTPEEREAVASREGG